MDKQPKEIVASADDSCLSVFVRSRPLELAADELAYIAGGCGPEIDPNG